MIAVLINAAQVRLGEKSVPADCNLIAFGGGFFIRSAEKASLDGGGFGAAFEETLMYVINDLDRFDPRRGAIPKP